MDRKTVALSLFSGGLDSILASRVVAAQGIKVIAVKFVSPFFDYTVLRDPDGYIRKAKELYGIDVIVEDITKPYLQLLHRPSHGFGKNFNPCIDCKIFMFSRARSMMKKFGASFLISGEVLGQRPMSQRRDTLNVIERDSGNRDILLRPLSAKLLTPTTMEEQGLVDREKLLDFSGRGRSRQIALAEEYGITEFPAPAGGCRLADPILSKRIARIYNGDFVLPPSAIDSFDVLCLMTGRQFLLPGGGWLVVGRDEKDNNQLSEFKQDDDILFCMEDHPGPTALLRRTTSLYEDQDTLNSDMEFARGLVVRYAKKVDGVQQPQVVQVHSDAKVDKVMTNPLEDEIFRGWLL
ncbi:MAG: thiamine biosynthesis protein [Desulfocapsaceae bacterium]|nr:thiamine biosynthesis protein [Desulfocapsaceae bacterium]